MCTIIEPDREPDEELNPAYLRDIALQETPEYQTYLAELDAQEQRARQRRGKPAPMACGTDLGGDRYFCPACWYAGFEDGGHSHEHPPCDMHPRVPFDPR